MLILGTVSSVNSKSLVKPLQCLGLWKEGSFHLGLPAGLQRRRRLPPARCVSPPCKRTGTDIISSVCSLPTSGSFPTRKFKHKLQSSRTGTCEVMQPFSCFRKKLHGLTDSLLLVQRYLGLFSLNPRFNLHFALPSPATNTTLSRLPEQYALSDSHRSNHTGLILQFRHH